MLVVSDVEVWHIVQESDNVAVIYLTQEFWVRLDLVNSQIITSQHSPTWQDSNSHCRENRLFQSADGKESRWSKYSWGALQYRDWVSRQRISSHGFSVPQGQRIPTLSTPSRAAQVPEMLPRTNGAESRFLPHATQHADVGLLTVWPRIYAWENVHTYLTLTYSLMISHSILYRKKADMF